MLVLLQNMFKYLAIMFECFILLSIWYTVYGSQKPITASCWKQLKKTSGKTITWVIGVARIFDWGGGGQNHKSHAITSSETSKEEFFGGAKIS